MTIGTSNTDIASMDRVELVALATAARAQASTLHAEAVPVGGGVTLLCRQVKVPLSMEGGTLCSIASRQKTNNGWESVLGMPFINAAGYNEMNRHAGVSFLVPPSVTVDGENRPNPFYLRDEVTKHVDLVYVRMVGRGRNAAGSMVEVDHIVIYSPRLYLLEDLQGKERRYPAAVKGVSMQVGEKAPKGWFYFPQVSNQFGSVGMIVDASHQEVRKAFSTLTQRVKKCLSIAQTFCRRDILGKMLGTQLYGLTINGEGFAVVTAWTEHDGVDTGQPAERVVTDARSIGHGELALGESIEDVQPQSEPPQTLTPPSDDGERAILLADLRVKYAELGGPEFMARIKAAGFDASSPGDMSDGDLNKLHNHLHTEGT